MKDNLTVEKLATQIGICPNFIEIVNGGKNPCEEIVNSQIKVHSPSPISVVEKRELFHTPEPWVGNLTTEK